MDGTRKVYFAGDLFDAKDLIGNALLAEAVEMEAGGRYEIVLPQDAESAGPARSAQGIRDTDFALLFQCDMLAACFDGADPDSGTVAEFCFAKAADIPAVLIRTDFRQGGDRSLPDGDPWNLMCSHYPRTEVVALNALRTYCQCREGRGRAEALTEFRRLLAQEVVRALDAVAAQPSWLKCAELPGHYRKLFRSIGGTLAERLAPLLPELLKHKAASGLYSAE